MLNMGRRVTIAGHGAVGVTLGGELLSRGFEVRYLGRSGPTAVEARLDLNRGTVHVNTVAPDAEWLKDTDVVLIAVKAYDLEVALKQALALTSSNASVIPISNGATWNMVRQEAKVHPGRRMRLGFCTFGVTEMGDQHFEVKSRVGELSFGPLDPSDRMTTTEGRLVEPPAFFVWHANIQKLQVRKWLYNVVINSLTAGRSLQRNGDLMHDLPTLTAVFNEACSLATELWGPLPLERSALFAGLEQLIERTSENENSMARDQRLLRRTESDYLAGLAQDQSKYPLLSDLHLVITRDLISGQSART